MTGVKSLFNQSDMGFYDLFPNLLFQKEGDRLGKSKSVDDVGVSMENLEILDSAPYFYEKSFLLTEK